MASDISNVILSVTRFMFVGEESVYRISINTIKEMEKKDRNLVFLKEKLSLFSRKSSLFSYKGLTSIIFTPFAFLGFVQPLFEASCHASLLCVCVDRYAVDMCITEYRDCATCDLVAP